MKSFNHNTTTSVLSIGKEIFKCDWLKLEIRNVFTAKPSKKQICKKRSVKLVDVCRKENSQFLQTLFILRTKTRNVFGRNCKFSCFYHNVFDISHSQHPLVRVSKGSNSKPSAGKLFQFSDLKTQHR